MGTAREPVAGSGVSCPAWTAKVSSFLFVVVLFFSFGVDCYQRFDNGVIMVLDKNIPKRIKKQAAAAQQEPASRRLDNDF